MKGVAAEPHLRCHLERPPGLKGRGKAPGIDRAAPLESRQARRSRGPLPDQHLAALRCALQPSRCVDGITGDREIAAALRREHLAGLDSDPDGESVAPLGDLARELEPGGDGSVGVVAVGAGNAENRHHRVADVLLDRPAMAGERLARQLEERLELGAQVLGVQAGGQLR